MLSRLRSLWVVLIVVLGLLPGMAVWGYAATGAPTSVSRHHQHHRRHQRRRRHHRRHHHRRHRHHHHGRRRRAETTRASAGGRPRRGGGSQTTSTTTTTRSATSTGTTTSTTTTTTTTAATTSTTSTTSSSTTTGSTSTSTTASGSSPTPIWADEFGGSAGSAPDPSKWQTITSPTGSYNNDLECYTNSSSNVGLDGQGHLAITALPGTGSCPYTSGRLQTNGLFQTEYGTLEASIQLPAGQGLWPSFWAMGGDRYTAGWPACGEIDVMENLGNDPFTNYGSIHGPQGSISYGHTTSYRSPTSLASGFHTYAVTWTPTSITYSVDGHTYATYTPSTLSAGQSWVFNQPYFLLLNLAVGGDWAGAPTSSTQFPATMLVDWVRVYS